MTKQTDDNPLAGCLAQKGDSFEFRLPESLPGETATFMADLLLSARSNPLSVDAGDVARIDTPCLQVLLSAARLWQEDAATMTYSAQSEVFTDNLTTLGLTMAELEVGDANHA